MMAFEVSLLLFSIGVLYYIFGRRGKIMEPPLFSGSLPVVQHTYLLINCDGRRAWELCCNTAAECWRNGVVKKGADILLLSHYVIGDPDDVLTVSKSRTSKHFVYKFLKPQFGNGLVTSQEEDWKPNRKQITPAFTPRSLKSLMGIFNKSGRHLCDAWTSEVGRPFEHMQSISEAILAAIVGEVDADCNISYKDYVAAAKKLDRAIALRMGHLPWLLDFIFNLSNEGRVCKKAEEHVRAEGMKIINAAREKARINATKNMNDQLNRADRYTTVVQYIIENCDFDDKQLLDEVNTMLVAGHTTTASTLTTFLVILGSYSHVQDRLYEELLSVFGSSDMDVVKDGFLKMPYLDAVLKETLRLYPAVPFLFRNSETEMVVKNYTLSKGSRLVVNIYAVNRHPVWGEDRMDFRPERWLEPDKLPPQHAFVTFNIGKRSCLGRDYSLLSMKTIITHIVRRYKVFSDISKYEIALEYLIKPAAGGIITLKERKNIITS